MSKAHIFKDMKKREEREEKAAEKGFVRAEKAVDEAIAKKLTETYGSGPAQREDGKLARAWRCHECRFANYESRLACANCLAVPPQKGKDGTVRAAPANIAGRPSTRDNTVVLTHVGERHYRSYAPHAVAMKRALAGEAAGKRSAGNAGYIASADQNDDGADEPEDPATAVAAASPATDGAKLEYDKDRRLVTLKVQCPRRYHRFVVGQGAKTLKDIERTANVKLLVPKDDGSMAMEKAKPAMMSAAAPDDDEEEDVPTFDPATLEELDPVKDIVTIEGNSVAGVRVAQLRIDAIVAEAKDKVDYTHFLSIPLGPIPSAKATFTSLIDDMRSAIINDDHNIDFSLFQRPARVHVTLLMLRLYSKSDLDLAKLVLEALEPELQHIFGPSDKITLKGLETMNADARAAHVVYMAVARDEIHKRLQALVTRINNAFIDAGLAKPADVQGNGKLHATIMNSKWRRGGGQRTHQPFNASEVLRIFGTRSFEAHHLRSIEINTLGGGAAPDGYFNSVASIGFP